MDCQDFVFALKRCLWEWNAAPTQESDLSLFTDSTWGLRTGGPPIWKCCQDLQQSEKR